MHFSRFGRRLTALLVASPLALSAVSAVAPAAQAAPGSLGTLATTPTNGISNDGTGSGRPYFKSTVACPSGTFYLDAIINGPSGSNWTHVQALNSVAYTAGSTINSQLGDTFSGIAQTNSKVLAAGTYTVTFECLDNFAQPIAGATGDAPLVFGSNTATTGFNNPWHVVNAPTSTALAVSPTNAAAGTTITMTGTVSPTGVAGTLTFLNGSTSVGTANIDGVGMGAGHNQGTTTATLPPGQNAITAKFAPTDTTWAGSTSTAQTVTITGTVATSTTTTLSASPASSAASGATVTLTAQLSPNNAAGTVQFKDGSQNIGSPAAVDTTTGKASTTTSSLTPGSHSLTAVFTPTDATAFAASTSAGLSYTITGATSTATGLSIDPGASAPVGTTVTLTAKVTPTNAAGTMQFKEDGANLGSPVAVSAGSASFSSATFTAGTHTFSASFVPTDTSAFAPSTTADAAYVVAAQIGSLAITNSAPGKVGSSSGLDTDRPQVTTTSNTKSAPGCPSSSSQMGASWIEVSQADNGTIAPAWAKGLIAMGSTNKNNYSSTSEIVNALLDDTWEGIASVGGVPQITGQPGHYIPAGHFQVRLDCLDFHNVLTGFFVGDVYFTDSTHWQTSGPTQTSTALSASPTGVADLGTPVTLTATVTPTVASGTVQFQDVQTSPAQNLGSPVTVTGGTAKLALSSLPYGMHTFQAKFTPSNASQYAPSTSGQVGYAVRYPAPPTYTSPAQLMGNAMVDHPISCAASAPGASSLTYAWLVDGSEVATGQTYSPTGAQALHQLACQARAYNQAPNPGVSTSASVVVAKAHLALVRVPTISGARTVGAVVTANHGAWTPAPTSYLFQWYRDGRAIPRATQARYRLTRADKGHALSIRVTAVRLGYVNGVAYGPRLSNTVRPTIVGVFHPGHTLTGRLGTWSPSATGFSVYWTRDGVVIRGATRRTYLLVGLDRGHVIAFHVVAHRATFADGLAGSVGVRIR